MVPEPYPLGYTPSMVFTQPPVEAALREHAAAYDSVEVELGTELLGFEQSPDHVTLHLRDDSDATRSVTADYVIACDGASSATRQQLGIAFEDLVFDEPWLVVDLQVHDAALARLPETAAQFCEPSRPTSFIVGPRNHRRFEIMLLPGEDPREMEDPVQVWRLLARWLAPDDATLWRAASYRFHALVAREWRRGRDLPRRRRRPSAASLYRPGHVPGSFAMSEIWSGSSTGSCMGIPAPPCSTPMARNAVDHVRQLTTRIKAIGHVICERDPVAADASAIRASWRRAAADARTVTRQEIVPPLRKGLLAFAAASGARHAVSAALDQNGRRTAPARRRHGNRVAACAGPAKRAGSVP